jgi:hypothetical protein
MQWTISPTKTMISVYFSRCGFVSLEFLPMGQKYSSQFFTETVSPNIERKFAECRPKLRATTVHLHIGNATPHTSKMSIEKIEELGFILVLQPPYSPPLAPCDFFLCGYLKQYLEGKQFTTEDSVISAVREGFDKIQLQMFQNVLDDWQYRLRKCIQLGGNIFCPIKEIRKASHIRQSRRDRPDLCAPYIWSPITLTLQNPIINVARNMNLSFVPERLSFT